jgi:hypothetical protein
MARKKKQVELAGPPNHEVATSDLPVLSAPQAISRRVTRRTTRNNELLDAPLETSVTCVPRDECNQEIPINPELKRPRRVNSDTIKVNETGTDASSGIPVLDLQSRASMVKPKTGAKRTRTKGSQVAVPVPPEKQVDETSSPAAEPPGPRWKPEPPRPIRRVTFKNIEEDDEDYFDLLSKPDPALSLSDDDHIPDDDPLHVSDDTGSAFQEDVVEGE